MAAERWKDGGSSSLGIMTRGRWMAVASAKVGRCSLMATRAGILSWSCKMEDRREESDDLLDTWSDIYL